MKILKAMRLYVFFVMLITPLAAWAGVMNYLPLDGDWKIKNGKTVFTVYHILHSASGESSAFDQGQSHCDKDRCQFTIKTKVSTFKTADKKREEEMHQTLDSQRNPDLTLTGEVQKKDSTTLMASFEIHLAGKKSGLKNVEIQIDREWSSLTTKGRFDTKLSNFLPQLPSLLGIPIDDKLSVQFDITWEKAP